MLFQASCTLIGRTAEFSGQRTWSLPPRAAAIARCVAWAWSCDQARPCQLEALFNWSLINLKQKLARI
eukprot:322775-Amphidinium_carterae.1